MIHRGINYFEKKIAFVIPRATLPATILLNKHTINTYNYYYYSSSSIAYFIICVKRKNNKLLLMLLM